MYVRAGQLTAVERSIRGSFVQRRFCPTVLLVLFLVAFAAAAGSAAAAAIPGRYIVILKDSVSAPGQVASEHAQRYGARVSHVYTHALKGYAATIPAKRLAG